MERFHLVDIWRVKFPDAVTFTWSNKENTRLSRLDFWLVSKNINEQDVTINITPCPFSDHKAIHISINLFPSVKNCKAIHWKLNNTLLKYEEVKTKISQFIRFYFNKAKIDNSFGSNWELFKYESGEFLRAFGSYQAKIRNLEEQNIISDISLLSQPLPDTLTEEDKKKMV